MRQINRTVLIGDTGWVVQSKSDCCLYNFHNSIHKKTRMHWSDVTNVISYVEHRVAAKYDVF